MMIIDIYGHLIILCIGIPLIVGLVSNLRERRIEGILMHTVDKMKHFEESLNQIINIQQKVKEIGTESEDDTILIGIVHLHVLDCNDSECPCKRRECKQIDINKQAKKNSIQVDNMNFLGSYHRDKIFLSFFVRKLYEDALNKFSSVTTLHLAFSYYLFDSMKNTHAALLELNSCLKKKPSLKDQFTIFRYKKLIENFIIEESSKAKDMYAQLTNVVEFETLLTECQKAIEKVCNMQMEFWSQVTNQLPDLNILHDIGKKLYEGNQLVEDIWTKLCKINSNYPKALNLYGNYMIEIRNHTQLGYEMIEKYGIL